MEKEKDVVENNYVEEMGIEEEFDDLDDFEFSELSKLEEEAKELHGSDDIVDSEQWEDLLERVTAAKPKPERGLIPIQSKRKMRQLERRFDLAIEDDNQAVQDRIADSMIFKEDMESWKSLKAFCRYMASGASKKRVSGISYNIEES